MSRRHVVDGVQLRPWWQLITPCAVVLEVPRRRVRLSPVGALALLLTLSGLFGVLSYLVEQRTREFGVWMALGATSRSIAALVLSQSARPVGIGLLLGSSLMAALGTALMATTAAEQIGSSVHLLDPVAYGASLLWIVTACTSAALIPALRAGRIDPVGALRHD